ncbi:MAG: CRTAC1 family protein [Pseudomonadota bacterium]
MLHQPISIAFFLTGSLALAAPSQATPRFQDLSQQLNGFINYSPAQGDGFSGLVWVDYDGDGDEDLFVTGGLGARNGLLRNDSGTFNDVTEEAGLLGEAGGSGAIAVDLDNDGFRDIVVVADGAWASPRASYIRFYHNLGDGTFDNLTSSSNLNLIPQLAGQAQHISAADVDNDGYVDLLILAPGNINDRTQPKNLLFRNNGDLTFMDVSNGSGVDTAFGACASVFTDYNNDGMQDVIIADCHEINGRLTPIEILVNNGDFTFAPLMSYAGTDSRDWDIKRGYWMCMDLADIDLDLDQDMFATNAGPNVNSDQEHGLFERLGNGKFRTIEREAGISAAAPDFGFGCGFGDLDNDQYVDLLMTGSFPKIGAIGPGLGSPTHVFHNQGDSTFESIVQSFNTSNRFTSGLAIADYNRDGLLDFAVGTGPAPQTRPTEKPILLRNNTENAGNWVSLRLIGNGVTDNRDAIGARVRILAGGVMQEREIRAGSSWLSQHSLRVHFGLGQATEIKRLEVRWPSGEVSVKRNLPVNEYRNVRQPD